MKRKSRRALCLLAISASSAFGTTVNSTWVGGIGNWSNAAGWTPNSAAPNDNSPAGTLYNATVSAGSILTLDTSPTIQQLTLDPSSGSNAGAQLEGGGTLTLEGALALDGGVIGNFDQIGPTINLGSAITGLANQGNVFLSGTINNTGTATLNAYVSLGAEEGYSPQSIPTLNNAEGATLNIQADFGYGTAYYEYGGVPSYPDVINNAGAVNKIGGTGTSTVWAYLANSGSLLVGSGALLFDGGGTETGSFEVAAGCTLGLSGYTLNGPYGGSIPLILTSSATVSGAGNVSLGSCTINPGSTYNPQGTTTVNGGVVNFDSGKAVVNGPLNVAGGTVYFNTGNTVTPASITLSGGNIGVGTDAIATNGIFTWTWGDIGAIGATGPVINAYGGMNIAEANIQGVTMAFLSGTINNGGTATMGPSVFAQFTATGGDTPGTNTIFNNLPGATFIGGMIYYGNGINSAVPDQFNNEGTVDGGATFYTEFNNSGIVSGGINLEGGGIEGGSFIVPAGQTITLGGGRGGAASVYTFTSTSAVSGAGALVVGELGSTCVFDGGAIIGPGGGVAFSGGTATVEQGAVLDTAGPVAIGGTIVFNNGAVFDTTGLVTIGPNSLLQIHSAQTFGSVTFEEQFNHQVISGSLDVTTSDFILDYGSNTDPRSSIVSYLASGYNHGNWNGPGIVSSVAAAYGPSGDYGVGYADGADGLDPNLTSGQLEVAYALYGDITLQGFVGGDDLSIFAKYYGQTVSGGWADGDFNNDGVVNAADFVLLARNFGFSTSGAPVTLPPSDWTALYNFAAANNLLSDLPEPTSSGVLALSTLGVIRRRRRPRQSASRQ
jgi:hypothetical protein